MQNKRGDLNHELQYYTQMKDIREWSINIYKKGFKYGSGNPIGHSKN